MSNFRKYNFITSNEKNDKYLEICQNIHITSEKVDNNLVSIYSIGGGGSFSIYLQDRFFNINVDNDTKNVYSFEGDLYLKSLRYKTLDFPTKIIPALLKLDTQDNLVGGCGSYIEFNTKNLFYDKVKKLLQIGNIKQNTQTYQFLGNAFAQLENNILTGITISDIEI